MTLDSGLLCFGHPVCSCSAANRIQRQWFSPLCLLMRRGNSSSHALHHTLLASSSGFRASRGSRSSSLSIIIITDRPSYTVVDCRRPSFLARCCSCFCSTMSRNICNIQTSFLQSSEETPFRPFLSQLSVLLVKWLVSLLIIGPFNRVCYLLTYLLTLLRLKQPQSN